MIAATKFKMQILEQDTSIKTSVCLLTISWWKTEIKPAVAPQAIVYSNRNQKGPMQLSNLETHRDDGLHHVEDAVDQHVITMRDVLHRRRGKTGLTPMCGGLRVGTVHETTSGVKRA